MISYFYVLDMLSSLSAWFSAGMNITDTGLLLFILAGFTAQMIDGSLGMAYGISSNTFLVSLGLPPANASASVHIAETFIAGVSGLSHLRFKNVNKKLLQALIIPGCLGVILGAYILSNFDGNLIKPYIAVYLLIMGVIVIRKALSKSKKKTKTKRLYPLAFVGGFLDAIGGGGWGPVVVSTLLKNGRNARYTVGTVNLAEFFISLAGAGTFLIFLKISDWNAVIGLLIGGVIAAPFAAYLCTRINPKIFMILVGVVIILLSMRTIYASF
jgi:uncharacterized membrane protein YfcA